MESKNQKLAKTIGKPILRPLVILQLLLVLMLFSSPFVWIWYNGSLALKIGLTGLVGAIIVSFIVSVVENSVQKIVSEAIEKKQGCPTERKSKFQTKMEEMIKAKEQK